MTLTGRLAAGVVSADGSLGGSPGLRLPTLRGRRLALLGRLLTPLARLLPLLKSREREIGTQKERIEELEQKVAELEGKLRGADEGKAFTKTMDVLEAHYARQPPRPAVRRI